MKKFISVLLSAVLLLAVFAPFYTTVNDCSQRKNVARFCAEVAALTQKYDSNLSYVMYDEVDETSFVNTSVSTNRLIIKTDDKINDANAVDSVYGLNYAVLQYNSEGDMLNAYKKFTAMGYTVDEDCVISISDTEEPYEENKSLSSDNITPAAVQGSTGYYENCGSNITKNLFADCTEEIVVGIMDTGIDYNHEFFKDRYVHCAKNFGSSGNADDPMDDHYHGTACASIVLGNTPDNVKVKPYKILNSDGSGSEVNVIAACEYILSEKDKPDVVNMSFGAHTKDGSFTLVNEGVEKLCQNGIAVSVAAGNESLPSDFMNPAKCEGVITVASCNDENVFSSYSNYGKVIDVTAPGENIWVAIPGNDFSTDYSGTSFSAPCVSAACAYVLMQNPAATPAEIKEKIKSTAVDMGEDDRFYYGAGVMSFVNLACEFTCQAPTPNVTGGLYHDTQTIDFGNIPQGRLMYTTDRTIPSAKNGTEYTGPITIDRDTQINYALVSENDYISPIASQYYTIQYYAPSSDFTLIAGTIMKYKGDKTNFVVPDKIGGLKPTGIYKELFKDSNLTGIVLPESVTTLGTGCFQGSSKLKHIVAPGVTKLNGDSVFMDCSDLRDEVMPKLKTVTQSAFQGCKRLHQIDFGENLTEFKNDLFSSAGLMYGNFPNVKENKSEGVFKNCPLFTCNIPKYTKLYTNFFYGCNLLYELNIGQVTEIFNSALYYCSFLTEFDTSQIVKLNTSALSGCCIDTFYAPKCTSMPDKFGSYCHIRVIDLPNAEGEIGSNLFNCSTTEELYLEKVTNVSKTAFKNAIKLNVLYLPNAQQYYAPFTNVSQWDELLTGDYWKQNAPLEIIWVPSAQLPEKISSYGTKLIYAPSTSTLILDVQSNDIMPNIVVSDKVTDGNITVTNSGKGAVIVAPDGSYAQRYGSDENCGYTFVSTDDVRYSKLDERNYFTYVTQNSDFSVPYRFISSYWNNSVINKNRSEIFHGFLIDFANDNVLNAKDYAILQKAI